MFHHRCICSLHLSLQRLRWRRAALPGGVVPQIIEVERIVEKAVPVETVREVVREVPVDKLVVVENEVIREVPG